MQVEEACAQSYWLKGPHLGLQPSSRFCVRPWRKGNGGPYFNDPLPE